MVEQNLTTEESVNRQIRRKATENQQLVSHNQMNLHSILIPEFANTQFDTKLYFKKKFFNLSKPTGHVMHQQFNIQQLYVLPTLYLCVLYLSENKQRLVPLTA